MTTLRAVGGKVGVVTHETTIISLAPRVGSDGPNSWRLHNKLSTHVVFFPGFITLNFRGQPVLN